MTDVIFSAGIVLCLFGMCGFYMHFDYAPYMIVGCVIGLMMIVYAADADERRRHSEFMQACKQDRKEYECTAMWRAGSNAVVPYPVVIGGGR